MCSVNINVGILRSDHLRYLGPDSSSDFYNKWSPPVLVYMVATNTTQYIVNAATSATMTGQSNKMNLIYAHLVHS